MTDLIDGVAVFEQREAEARAAGGHNTEPKQPASAFSFSPRISVGPDTSAPQPRAAVGPAIDSHLDLSNQDILATGRTQSGFQRSNAELGLDDLVTIHGDPTTVRVALRLGYLAGREGDFRDTGLAAKEAAGVPAQDAPNKPVKADYTGNETPLQDHKAENILTHLVGATPADAQIRAMNDVIRDGEVSTNTLMAMASLAKVSPQALQADLERVQDAFAAQAASAVMAAGVTDPDAFVQWAEKHHRGEFEDAASQHVLDRNPKAYGRLVAKYLASGDGHTMADLLAATSSTGVKVRKVDGQAVVDLPGHGSMPYQTAIREGLIRVSRG